MFYIEKDKARVKTRAYENKFFVKFAASIQPRDASRGLLGRFYPELLFSPVMHLGAYYCRFYPEHISHESGFSSEHAIAAC